MGREYLTARLFLPTCIKTSNGTNTQNVFNYS